MNKKKSKKINNKVKNVNKVFYYNEFLVAIRKHNFENVKKIIRKDKIDLNRYRSCLEFLLREFNDNIMLNYDQFSYVSKIQPTLEIWNFILSKNRTGCKFNISRINIDGYNILHSLTCFFPALLKEVIYNNIICNDKICLYPFFIKLFKSLYKYNPIQTLKALNNISFIGQTPYNLLSTNMFRMMDIHIHHPKSKTLSDQMKHLKRNDQIRLFFGKFPKIFSIGCNFEIKMKMKIKENRLKRRDEKFLLYSKICNNCNKIWNWKKEKSKEKFKTCKKCKKTYYCSRKCQKIDWKKGHKNFCNPNINMINFDSYPHFLEAPHSFIL